MKLHVQRVPLDRGGYDRHGRYWGAGQNLYRVSGEEGHLDIDEHVRASSPAAARTTVAVRHGLTSSTHRIPGSSKPRAPRARKKMDVDAKIAEVRELRERIASDMRPLFDHLLNLAKHSYTAGYPQRAGRELRQARLMATKYPATGRDARSRRDAEGVWRVALQVRSPSRPNLRHQLQYTVRATSKDDAIAKASRSSRAEGHEVVGVVSAVRGPGLHQAKHRDVSTRRDPPSHDLEPGEPVEVHKVWAGGRHPQYHWTGDYAFVRMRGPSTAVLRHTKGMYEGIEVNYPIHEVRAAKGSSRDRGWWKHPRLHGKAARLGRERARTRSRSRSRDRGRGRS